MIIVNKRIWVSLGEGGGTPVHSAAPHPYLRISRSTFSFVPTALTWWRADQLGWGCALWPCVTVLSMTMHISYLSCASIIISDLKNSVKLLNLPVIHKGKRSHCVSLQKRCSYKQIYDRMNWPHNNNYVTQNGFCVLYPRCNMVLIITWSGLDSYIYMSMKWNGPGMRWKEVQVSQLKHWCFSRRSLLPLHFTYSTTPLHMYWNDIYIYLQCYQYLFR